MPQFWLLYGALERENHVHMAFRGMRKLIAHCMWPRTWATQIWFSFYSKPVPTRCLGVEVWGLAVARRRRPPRVYAQ